MEKELYHTVILKRKPSNEGFTPIIPAFDEPGEVEGDDAEEFVNRATGILERRLEI